MIAKRLRLADGETMAIETLHVPESLVPGLTPPTSTTHSFYELLSDRYGIEIVGGIQTIEPTVTNEEESRRSACRSTRRRSCSSARRARRRRIVEFVRSIYRGDRYRLVTELNRRDRAGRRPVFVPREGTPARAPCLPAASPSPARSCSSSEIREQPRRSPRLLEHAGRVRGVAACSRARDLVRMVGHGSSDNAASYGVYAFGLLAGLDGAARLDLALRSTTAPRSTSARSASSRSRSRAGRRTSSSTSSAPAPRARHDRDHERARTPPRRGGRAVLPLGAGPEHAIAATKTYTRQLAALALLAGARGRARRRGRRRDPATADLLDGRSCRRSSGGSPRSRSRSPSSAACS